MAEEQLEDTINYGNGITMTFLRDSEWVVRNHISGGEELNVPAHWHEAHDEYFRILKGKLKVLMGKTWKEYTPEDGEIKIPRGVVHSLRSITGVEVICEERTDPADGEKELFFRNLLAKGSLPTNLFDAMLTFYHGDCIPAFPGHVMWFERAFVTIIGGYIAPALGYKRSYESLQKVK